MGHDEAHIFLTSGMILRPDFYVQDNSDPVALRMEMGLREDLPTAIVLFGGHGSKVMYDITEKLDASELPLQLILICGRNEELAGKLALSPVEDADTCCRLYQGSAPVDARGGFSDRQARPGQHRGSHGSQTSRLDRMQRLDASARAVQRRVGEEKGVGIVLNSFRQVEEGVNQMLDPAALAAFRRNVAALENRAIFEIPEILARLLGESHSDGGRTRPAPVGAKAP